MIPDPRSVILDALEILDNEVEDLIQRTADPTDVTPIYDALLREVTTGRDATGRFVRRCA